jgi:hypothetical protein
MAIAANSSERVHPFQQQVCRGAHSIFRRQLIPKKNERLSSDLKEEFALLAKPYPKTLGSPPNRTFGPRAGRARHG